MEIIDNEVYLSSDEFMDEMRKIVYKQADSLREELKIKREARQYV